MFTKEHLTHALAGLGCADVGTMFAELKAQYTSASRYYHSERHIVDCLQEFQLCYEMAEHPAEVEVALWFHDAVYDTHRNDNEEQSASLATSFLLQNNVERGAVQRISALILATKTHSNLDTTDQRLIVDVDLSILGSSSERFDEYDRGIRAEYSWVPEEDYRKGRRAVLEGFLERDAIFYTSRFKDLYEQRARENLVRTLEVIDRK